jgi:hypothetical protein
VMRQHRRNHVLRDRVRIDLQHRLTGTRPRPTPPRDLGCLVRHQLVEPNLASTAAYYAHHQTGKHTGHTKRGVHQTRDGSAARTVLAAGGGCSLVDRYASSSWWA